MCNWRRWLWFGCSVIFVLPFGRAAEATQARKWPDGTPAELRDDLVGLRLRVARELKGDKAGEKFLREAFAKTPDSAVKAHMAWVCFFGKDWGMPSMVDPVRGKLLAVEAAAEGSKVAAEVYGRAIMNGLVAGVPPMQGVAWLQKGAEADMPRSLARLGVCYMTGFGVTRNPTKGIALARRAAELGFPLGLTDIGTGLADGNFGLPPDLPMVLNLYHEAARHNDPDAWVRLQKIAENNPKTRVLLLASQVHEANNLAWTVSGKANDLTWILSSNVRKRVKELEQLTVDEPVAMLELGEAYLMGYHAPRDYAKAKAFLEKAVAKGSEDAQVLLAMMKLRGFGQPKDAEAGLAVIQRLADAGNHRAAGYLGWVHYWGVSEAPGLAKDEAKAFHYARVAAERGDVWSLINLGACYEHGVGTPENYLLAAKVYWQAYQRGFKLGLDKTRRLLNFVKE